MKAEVKATNEIVDVYHPNQHGQTTILYKESKFINGRMWTEDELDFNIKDLRYDSYKTSIESIKECIERFRECGNDKDDLINNIYIKCKNAIEYANTFKD